MVLICPNSHEKLTKKLKLGKVITCSNLGLSTLIMPNIPFCAYLALFIYISLYLALFTYNLPHLIVFTIIYP